MTRKRWKGVVPYYKSKLADYDAGRGWYQTTIFQHRIGEAWTGGPGDFVCFDEEPWSIPEVADDKLWDGLEYWKSFESGLVGRGKTPQEALEDMIARHRAYVEEQEGNVKVAEA